MPNLSRRGFLLSVVGSTLTAGSGVMAGEPAPLAIKGYDPVAYFTLGRPAQGLPDFEHEWDEQRYRFISADHRALFEADPTRYTPQFSGLCAMALTRGEIVEPDPEYWLVSEGRLYVFGKPFGPALFQKDLADNLKKADFHAPAKR